MLCSAAPAMATVTCNYDSTTKSGQIGKKRLRPGRYRMLLTARDAAGNVSTPATVRFRVVRLPRRHR